MCALACVDCCLLARGATKSIRSEEIEVPAPRPAFIPVFERFMLPIDFAQFVLVWHLSFCPSRKANVICVLPILIMTSPDRCSCLAISETRHRVLASILQEDRTVKVVEEKRKMECGMLCSVTSAVKK